MEIFKERIDGWMRPDVMIHIRIAIAVVSTAFFAAVAASIVLWGAVAACAWVVVFLVFMAWVELKLRTNPAFARDNKVTVREALRTCKTGDLVFFRSYHSYDVPELFFYRWIHAAVAETYFGHIGMIVREGGGGRPLILECTEDPVKCVMSNLMKDGVALNDAETRIMNYIGRVHLVGNDLQLPYKRVMRYARALKDLRFLENGVGCCPILRNLLIDCGAMRKSWGWVPRCSYFLQPSNYTRPITFHRPKELLNLRLR